MRLIWIYSRLSWFVEGLSWCPFAKRSVSCFEYVCLNFVQISVNGGVAALLSELAVLKKRLRPIGAHPCPYTQRWSLTQYLWLEKIDGKHQDIQYYNAIGLCMILWRFLRNETQKYLKNKLSIFFSLFRSSNVWSFFFRVFKVWVMGFLQELSGFSGLGFDVLHWRVFFRWSVSSPRLSVGVCRSSPSLVTLLRRSRVSQRRRCPWRPSTTTTLGAPVTVCSM